jgi:hypothetical protein
VVVTMTAAGLKPSASPAGIAGQNEKKASAKMLRILGKSSII